VPPTLTIPVDALAALALAAGDHLPPSAATDRHLDDTIAVRDRMTTLVEKLIDAELKP
jgi:TolB-like protein